MIVVLAIVLIIGNLFLLTGTIFDDLADNGIAWVIVIGAIAMDAFLIYAIASSVSESRKKQRKEAEDNRIAEVTRKVETLISEYTLMSLNAHKTAVPFHIAFDFINKEVVSTVKSYKERMATVYDRYLLVTDEIKRILACTGCISVDEKYSYLTANEDKLRKLKEEGDACLSQLSSYKIEMLNDDHNLLFELNLAFRYLLNSQKCQSESLAITEFIVPHKPSDLMLFQYEKDPVILFWEQYYFCLFSSVILVFDKNGVFSTAIDPSALKIGIKRETTSVAVRDGTIGPNQYIADDSKRISQGNTWFTWLHTCRDGSPDLRYSYNPRFEYRTDTYEYVVVELIIADKKVSFSASSEAVGDAFEKTAPKYSRKCNNRHNPIPEFLSLIKAVSGEDNAQIESIIQVCNARADANNYFCKLIAS